MTKHEQRWLGVYRSWLLSGKTQREFCVEIGVSKGTFAWWLRELRRRGLVERAGEAPPAAPSRPATPSLLPVTVTDTPDSSSWDERIEIVVDSRRVVRVPSRFDPDTLKRVVRALEDSSC